MQSMGASRDGADIKAWLHQCSLCSSLPTGQKKPWNDQGFLVFIVG